MAQVAAKRWEISPAVEEEVEPIAVPEGHLQKIGAGPFGEPPDKVRTEFTATRVVHLATEAFLLRDVSLAGAFCYCGRHKTDLYSPGQLPSNSREAAEFGLLDHCVLAGTYAGARWYGHMLHDDLPLQLAAKSLGQPVLNARRTYSHEPGWRDVFDLPIPARYHNFFAREMVVISDFSQNKYKQDRMRTMRRKLAGWPKTSHRRLYVRRGAGGSKRVLVNETEVISSLERQLGFCAFCPDGLSASQIVDQCNGAEIAVSVEGSHAVPLMYTVADEGKVVFLLPPNRVTALMPNVFRTAGVRSGMFIGDAHGNGQEEFTVNAEELVRFVESFGAGK
jgi:capsular polysaccharide biosynthesis protein